MRMAVRGHDQLSVSQESQLTKGCINKDKYASRLQYFLYAQSCFSVSFK